MTLLERVAALEAKLEMTTDRLTFLAGMDVKLLYTIIAALAGVVLMVLKKHNDKD